MRNERGCVNFLGKLIFGVGGGFVAGSVTGFIIGNIGEAVNKVLNEPVPPGFIFERSVETLWIIVVPLLTYISLTEHGGEST